MPEIGFKEEEISMSANPEVEGIVALPVQESPVQTNGHLIELAPQAQALPVEEPIAAKIEEPVAPKIKARRARPAWLASATLGAVALLATGTLGYVSFAASQQRNAAYDAFVGTKATLVATDGALSQAKADAASKKVTADYAALFVLDEGKVQLDYQNIQACSSYGACRTSGQDLLNDLQKFQADRTGAAVPSNLGSADASLGDAISAAIAADQLFINGMDSFSVSKVKDGLHKLDAAMLNLGKAQVALGNGLQ